MSKALKLLEKVKNLNIKLNTNEGNSLSDYENDYFSGVYSVQTSEKQIRSEITYIKKDNVIILTSKTPQKYESYWEAKSAEKALNLLKKAEIDFKAYNKKGSAPTLRTMEQNYANYLNKEIDSYKAPWD